MIKRSTFPPSRYSITLSPRALVHRLAMSIKYLMTSSCLMTVAFFGPLGPPFRDSSSSQASSLQGLQTDKNLSGAENFSNLAATKECFNSVGQFDSSSVCLSPMRDSIPTLTAAGSSTPGLGRAVCGLRVTSSPLRDIERSGISADLQDRHNTTDRSVYKPQEHQSSSLLLT